MVSNVDLETAEARLERLQELEDFTESCKKQVDGVFTALGWKRFDPAFGKEVEMVKCPLDPSHRVPKLSLSEHRASCRLKKMGYSTEEQEEMADPSFCYEGTNVSTFVMDEATQHEVILEARSAAPLMKMEGIFWQESVVSVRGSGSERQYSGEPVDVPQNHKRALCDLTVADRLALYDHVSSFLSGQAGAAAASSNEDLYVDLVKKMQKDEEQKEPKTHLELMAEMRDYKRRRQSYRAKNVHITKKSYTEVIREVIKVHSEELSRQWKEEEEEEEEVVTPSTHRHHSEEPRSREREPKKKKKKRERDSRSPDDHHERKKKKKKRKREEREKDE